MRRRIPGSMVTTPPTGGHGSPRLPCSPRNPPTLEAEPLKADKDDARPEGADRLGLSAACLDNVLDRLNAEGGAAASRPPAAGRCCCVTSASARCVVTTCAGVSTAPRLPRSRPRWSAYRLWSGFQPRQGRSPREHRRSGGGGHAGGRGGGACSGRVRHLDRPALPSIVDVHPMSKRALHFSASEGFLVAQSVLQCSRYDGPRFASEVARLHRSRYCHCRPRLSSGGRPREPRRRCKVECAATRRRGEGAAKARGGAAGRLHRCHRRAFACAGRGSSIGRRGLRRIIVRPVLSFDMRPSNRLRRVTELREALEEWHRECSLRRGRYFQC